MLTFKLEHNDIIVAKAHQTPRSHQPDWQKQVIHLRRHSTRSISRTEEDWRKGRRVDHGIYSSLATVMQYIP
jgi:hypothetical protein